MKTERFTRERCAALGPAGVAEAVRELVPGVESVQAPVREIVASVRERGDAAVLELTGRLDLGGEEARPLRVSTEELDEAITQLPHQLVAGLQVAILNVSDVATAGVGAERTLELSQGHSIALRELPVDSAAVYVPGGRAPYPSTAVMGVVTARAAGVLDVCVCSPPGNDGEIDRIVLGACRLLGVERVYRMGGAQAIAALAHGTESVDPVDVIVGPGNLFVQEAKRQLSDRVGIDGIAGPSDLVLVAAAGANPRFAALDLLAQAEHGQGSLVVLVSAEQDLIEAIEREMQSDSDAQQGGVQDAALAIVHCESAADAIAIADRIAPEHMQLVGAEVEALSQRVRHAGCLFVGVGAGTAFGDYVAGSNHILPTNGAARFSSALDPRCFRRRMAEVRIPPQAAATLAAAGVPIARAEGFHLHAESMQARALAIGEN
ncbi:MAG TPA: histidinol dehydrogenase [Solirubrobacteraceae bacterium]